MKMKKWMGKMVSMMLVTGMAIGLAGCGSTSGTAAGNSAADATEVSTQSGDKLILGTSADYPPFEFIVLNEDGKQEYAGLDISLAEQLAKDMGKELEVVNMSFENLMTALQKGEVDMVIAAIEDNEERSKVADFSDSYYSDYPPKVLIKKDMLDTYTSLDSFSGKIVGAQIGTTKADIVTEKMTGATLTSLSSVTDLINNLEYDKCDAVVLDGAVAEKYASENDDMAVADVEVGDISNYAIAVQKGDPKNLLDSFNKTIKNAVDEGLIDKWSEESNSDSDQAVSN